uniref:Cyclic nucleotide-binding domain-containing protein n=1 Tax=Spumella elongata TaxID=89044 RepID=A0A7S3HEK0_9STRA|mmetsp:Transcript_48280/g.84590  ORF Transcript_48280/g.84590 Transcript_48280/m.84590 type:complete len:686 (+) Transcript_48280:90-2147(+)
MLSRLKFMGPLGKGPAFVRLLKRASSNQVPKQGDWFKETSAYAQNKFHSLDATMVSQSKISFQLPFKATKSEYTMSLSDLAGHSSFILLALSYLETDFLLLRMFAASGVSLSIIFQYYREKPLWIPIRWNTLFLVINVVMIGLLWKKEHEAHTIPSETKHLFESTFMKKGMTPVDFLHLCKAAERIEVKKGEVIISEKLKNSRVFHVRSGKLSVTQNGTLVRTIQPDQFVGSMSFLSWEDKIDAAQLQRKLHKDTLKNWSNKNSDTELFLPLLIIMEDLFERMNLLRHHHPTHEATCKVHHETEAAQHECSAKGHHHHHHPTSTTGGAEGAIFLPEEETNGFFDALFDDVPVSELMDDAPYGITVDELGNVISSESSYPNYTEDDHSERADEPKSSVLGQYLAASYSFVSQVVAPTTAESVPKEPKEQKHEVPVENQGGGMMGYADVVAEEDCILYFWSFNTLRSLIELYPSLGLAFERALSDDINKKMSRSMQSEPLQRYKLMLSGAVSGGEMSDTSKQILADFRAKHQISQKDHFALLEGFGWSSHDFSSGFKGAPLISIQEEYFAQLRQALEHSHEVPLTEEARTELRVFRLRNGINSSAHLAALKKLGWTVDEFEIGSQNPDHASAKETRAIVAHQYAERRSMIKSTILSYANILPSSWLPSSLLPETSAAPALVEKKKDV